MKLILRNIILFTSVFLLSSCRLFEDSVALQEKKQVLALKKLEAEQQKNIAELESKKSLALIEKEKILAIKKLDNELKEKKLNKDSKTEVELIKQKIALQSSNNNLTFQLYLFAIVALLIVIISGLIFYYFKRRAEDKLRVYEDNLKKYFYQKENETRLKIAQNILKTLKESNLSKENEKKLIDVFLKDRHEYDKDIQTIEAIEHKEKDGKQ